MTIIRQLKVELFQQISYYYMPFTSVTKTSQNFQKYPQIIIDHLLIWHPLLQACFLHGTQESHFFQCYLVSMTFLRHHKKKCDDVLYITTPQSVSRLTSLPQGSTSAELSDWTQWKNQQEEEKPACTHHACPEYVITFTFKAPVKGLVYGLLSGLNRVFLPYLPIVAAQDHNFPLSTTQRRKVWHLDDHWAVSIG